MGDDIQYVVIAVAVAVAVAYAGWRIYRALKHADDPCYGCEGCALKAAKQRHQTKKCPKNLADTNN